MAKVYKYGDNVDTDVIIPARYLNAPQKSELAKHCMEDIDLDFAKTVQQGDFIVAGANFGCGSSREHAPIAIQACGVKCVIAKSFARIFTATPSISASRSWSARRRRRTLRPVTRSTWISPPASSRIKRRAKRIRARRSPLLWRRSSRRAD